ncbi:PH domain-containing protein [Saccharothrix syringae]|uniref:PH domain-containing protein n=1 Tax=Saccharothrix syringae TaxID=103733 RepID=UPI00052599DD|nr:PH domain-containing protein [Saccharothrix syringae]
MNPPRSWSPKPVLVGVAWGLAAVSLLVTVLSSEATTRLLLGLATLLLLALGTHGTFVRPRLLVDDSGVTVRTPTGARHLPWHEVKVRLVHTRRLGRETATLELDWHRGEDEQLFVLTQLDLGTDPRDVADVLHALRP